MWHIIKKSYIIINIAHFKLSYSIYELGFIKIIIVTLLKPVKKISMKITLE